MKIPKRMLFFSLKRSFFYRASTFSQRQVFLQSIWVPRAKWPMNFLSEVDGHSRFLTLSACLSVFFFLSSLRIAPKIRHMQDKFFTTEQGWTIFTFLFWDRVLLTCNHIALLDKLTSTPRASWVAKASLHTVPGSQTDSWLWGTD